MNKLVCTNSENKNHLLHLTLNLIVVKILSFFDVDFNKSLYVSLIWLSDRQLDLLGNTALATNSF